MQRDFSTALADATAVATAAIELASQLGRLHHAAEQACLAAATEANREAEEEADDEWQSALHAAMVAIGAILDVPVQTVAELNQRSEAYLRINADFLCPKAKYAERYDGDLTRHLHDEERRDLLRATLAALASVSSPPPPETPFSRAYARATEAEAAHDRAAETYSRAHEAAAASVPVPAELLNPAYGPGAWLHTPDHIDQLPVSLSEKTRLLAVLQDYRPRREAAFEHHRLEELEVASDLTYDAVWEACEAAMNLPASSPMELFQKFRLFIMRAHIEWSTEHADDPALVSRLLSATDMADFGVGVLYMDAARVAGADTPILGAAPFDAAAWVAEAQAAGLAAGLEAGLSEDHDEGQPFAAEAFAGVRPLLRWQRQAVSAVIRRRGDGVTAATEGQATRELELA